MGIGNRCKLMLGLCLILSSACRDSNEYIGDVEDTLSTSSRYDSTKGIGYIEIDVQPSVTLDLPHSTPLHPFYEYPELSDTAAIARWLDSLIINGPDFSVEEYTEYEKIENWTTAIIRGNSRFLQEELFYWYNLRAKTRFLKGLSYYNVADYVNAKRYFQSSLEDANRANNDFILGSASWRLAHTYQGIGIRDSALLNLQYAFDFLDKGGFDSRVVKVRLEILWAQFGEGEMYESIQQLSLLRDTIVQMNDSALTVQFYGRLGDFELDAGELDSAKAHYELAEEFAPTGWKSAALLRAKEGLALTQFAKKDFHESLSVCRQGFSIAEDLPLESRDFKYVEELESYNELLITAGRCHLELGNNWEAIDFFIDAINNPPYHDREVSLARSYIFLGFSYGQLEQYDKAIKFMSTGISVADTAHANATYAWGVIEISRLYGKVGNYKKAYESLMNGIEIYGNEPQSNWYVEYITSKQKWEFDRKSQLEETARIKKESEKSVRILLGISVLVVIILILIVAALLIQRRLRKAQSEIDKQKIKQFELITKVKDLEDSTSFLEKKEKKLLSEIRSKEESISGLEKKLVELHDPLLDGLDDGRQDLLQKDFNIRAKDFKAKVTSEQWILIDLLMKNNKQNIETMAGLYSEKKGYRVAPRTFQELLKPIYDFALGVSEDKSTRKISTIKHFRKVLGL